ncbi:MAG: PilZ domain-containing protein [Thiohalomonadaceae bacterium]|jgi:hypothetical protein
MQERRTSPRIKIRFKIGVMLSSGGVHHVWSYDISLGGLQFLSDYSADVGSVLRIFFSVLDTATDEYIRVIARVRVAHQLYDGSAGCQRIGVMFDEFEGDGRNLYNQYLDSLLYVRYGQHLVT